MNRIAVLGSANVNLVVRQPRLPRPGETLFGTGFSSEPGGAGLNQAVAAARLDAGVDFLGMVGEDAHGEQIRRLLAREGIPDDGLESAVEPTGTAHTAVVDSGENSIVVVPGANAALTALSRTQREAIERAAFLMMQCELPVSALVEGLAAARAAGVFTVLTPAPVVTLPDGFLDLVDLIVPGRLEAAALTGQSDPVRAAELLSAGGTWAIVTLGAEGSVVAFDGSVLGLAPARPVRAVDTTAAGDTFVGVLVAQLAAGADRGAGAGGGDAGRGAGVGAGGAGGAAIGGRSISATAMIDAVRWATVASSVAVTRPGATSSMPTLAEVTAILA
ncbi:ribokinase [Cryobacterium sp. TMT1-21]|uniref:Ribokinase n=1 Tax=Cryobacterium shii TaxID=1259235 RepID=A0AAQ2C652_9MICO|nr:MULTISPECIES: ribokinase [Cryobacterium]TFC46587.1 ribokinase [Cryobacterium shii]TFC84584.1 ribokinase [Cryobacterium sp. TmT2-59]TFD14123.1 ribokinase [Cryobacterium sp. TMT4-10]TFD17605.1 ribokinase [Cryobacterium sp. TMT1-21]TFD22719.1 ribokinase [Cryobacterium sp. TMT2-23]